MSNPLKKSIKERRNEIKPSMKNDLIFKKTKNINSIKNDQKIPHILYPKRFSNINNIINKNKHIIIDSNESKKDKIELNAIQTKNKHNENKEDIINRREKKDSNENHHRFKRENDYKFYNEKLKERNTIDRQEKKKVKKIDQHKRNSKFRRYESPEKQTINKNLICKNKIGKANLKKNNQNSKKKNKYKFDNKTNSKTKSLKDLENKNIMNNRNQLLISEIKKLKKELNDMNDMKDKNQLLINEIEKLKKENNKLNENISFLNENNNNLENVIKKKDNEISILKEQEKERKSILSEKNNRISYLENIINKKDDEISKLKDKENDYENIIKNKDNEINTLKENENKINKYVNNINEIKEKLQNKIKENELLKKENLKIKNKEIKESGKKMSKAEESIKFYGFINNGYNCYLNSSLQLLTRINELKNGILNYQDNEINKDNDTKGQLFFEFKKIVNTIENSKNDNLTINPEKLKYIMGNINEIYYRNSQEDSNEFISNFISGLFKETVNKEKWKIVQKLDIKNEQDKMAYESFYKRFYIKKGYTFLMDIFYGIFKTINYCKTCKNTFSIRFNAYNMFELPLYKLAKKNKNKTLDLKEILNEYRAEKSLNYKCDCKNNSELFTKICLYTLPKYLILSFIRNVDNEYFYNNIKYDEILDIKTDYDNKSYNYSLESVIEHSGGINSGHYTALCKDKKNNKWYRFNDSYCDKYNCDFHSKNALLLLYKFTD